MRTRKSLKFVVAVGCGVVLALSGASAASATPVGAAWDIQTLAQTNVAEGETFYTALQLRNGGEETLDGSVTPITISGDMPEGFSVTRAESYSGVPCTIDAEGFECTSTSFSMPLEELSIVAVEIQVEPGTSGWRTAVYSVEGGAASNPSAVTAESTMITSEPVTFGIKAFDIRMSADPAGAAFTQAGGHPYGFTTFVDFNSEYREAPLKKYGWPPEPLKDVTVDLPDGFLANPTAADTCTLTELGHMLGSITPNTLCPESSQIGTMQIRSNLNSAGAVIGPVPLYNMVPPPDIPARFAFNLFGTIVVLDSNVSSEDGYHVATYLRNISEGLGIDGSIVKIWGVPAASEHTFERACMGSFGYAERCASPVEDVAFVRNATACTSSGEGLKARVRADSYFHPGDFDEVGIETHLPKGYPFPSDEWGQPQGPTGCENVPFEPSISIQPTVGRTDSPTGLEVDLTVPQDTLGEPSATSTSDLEDAVVTLPKGMTVNPSSADGLGSCSPAQIGLATPVGTTPAVFDEAEPTCPDSSKIGDVEIETPLLEDPLKGSVYLAEQGENPFGSLLAVYLVAEGHGALLKLPGEISPDVNGQLVTSFSDQPQLPFSQLHLSIFGGARAALRTPPICGTYATQADLTPWARPDEPVSKSSSFQIDQGCGGGFDPKLSAGTENPLAGTTSPFSLQLTREDGTQELGGISATLPPGLTGYLRGIPYCPDAALAAVSEDEGTGAAQEASPSCPSASQLGTVTVGAGAGANPFYTTAGRAYLAGPYKGAPLSIAVVTPAVAGPFDLGSVVVRNALKLDPETAQITAVSDPLPTILHGIPLDLRDVRVELDRPSFTLNPTSCDAMSIASLITSTTGATATPSERFQVAGCGNLAFKPSLKLRLKGKTNRGAHPALSAVLRARPGDANIGRLAVTLPKTELLENAHIRTTCTRVQFAAGGGGGEQCPAGSVYGQVKAISPLVDYTLEGPVFLRSSSHKLPDLVAVVKGPSSQPITIAAVGRIDTVRGRIRTSFETFPDTPISKVVLTMQGQKKGLLVNETELCRAKPKASVQFDGQNGKVSDSRPLVRADCGAARKRKRAHHRGGRG